MVGDLVGTHICGRRDGIKFGRSPFDLLAPGVVVKNKKNCLIQRKRKKNERKKKEKRKKEVVG